MNIYKVGTIKTTYSEEQYFFIDKEGNNEKSLELFLESICFCDDYDVLKIEDAGESLISKFENAIDAIISEGFEIDGHCENMACLYAKGRYETIKSMIKDIYC